VNIADIFEDNWRLKPKSAWPVSVQKALVGIKVFHTKDGGVSVQPTFARMEALTALAALAQRAHPTDDAGSGTSVVINLGGVHPVLAARSEPVQIGPLTICAPEEDQG